MYKVKQLYIDVSDDSGHTWLIKKEDYPSFTCSLVDLENKLYHEDGYDEDDYWIDFENLIEHYQAKRLEGEEVYVVLPNDLIEGEEQ